MRRPVAWMTVAAALALLPGCIVIHQAPQEPAPEPAPAPQPAPPPAPQPPPPQPVPQPEPLPPPPEEKPGRFGVSGVSASLFLPVSLEGRSKAVDRGNGGTLDLDTDLDLNPGPVLELRGTATTRDEEDFSVRFTALSLSADETLDGPRNHGGNQYPAGTELHSRMEWYYLEISADETLWGPKGRGETQLGMGVGFWWLGMEVGEDSMDSAAVLFGPSVAVQLRPAPMWELGGEAVARAGPAFPFPGIAGEASLRGWVGINLEDQFVLRIGYRGRVVGQRTTNVSLHYDSSEGTIDKNETLERDRLGFEIHGPFLELEFRF